MGQNTFRKFDAEAYVRTVETLALEEVGGREGLRRDSRLT
jgi:hypothetical protein